MLYYALKVLVSAILIVAISELAKRSSLLGALLASLPVTSLLAFIWLYRETHSIEKVAALSTGIFWLVLPSLILFLLLPWLPPARLGFLAQPGARDRFDCARVLADGPAVAAPGDPDLKARDRRIHRRRRKSVK